jgi:hypothetical protein
VEIRRTEVGGQPGQKVSETPSQQIIQALWCAFEILAIGEAQEGRSRFKACPRQKCKTLPGKTTKSKKKKTGLEAWLKW